ncbi:hypothetical protein [Clostridium rectalis]|uniref:hypothetical protein n=1 Tax=Clostridium rectalis TaxID=2040295 RepID=UPI000F642C65|nr:hypothetical protein [Clostridium rectalis]
MKELLSNEVREVKNKLYVVPCLGDMDFEESEIVVEILNMFNEKNYLISEATTILERCIEELKNCPVIKYKNY